MIVIYNEQPGESLLHEGYAWFWEVEEGVEKRETPEKCAFSC